MFTIRFVKQIENQYESFNYSCRWYRKNEEGKFTLYGFNGKDEDDVVIWVNGEEGNYEQAYVMNAEGKTIDSHRVSGGGSNKVTRTG